MRTIEVEARLTTMLEEAALDPAHLDVWEAWKVFKAFVREPVEADDEGITAQATRVTTTDGLDLVYLNFIRQFTTVEETEDTPVGYVGLELAYEWSDLKLAQDIELWSYDFPQLEDFMAQVEQLPIFHQAAALRPLESEVVAGEL